MRREGALPLPCRRAARVNDKMMRSQPAGVIISTELESEYRQAGVVQW